MTDEKLLSPNEVSKYLVEKYGKPAAVSVAHLRWLVTMGGGPNRIKIGRRVGYYPSELDKWHKTRWVSIKSRERVQPEQEK